jgi:hypothetical protein
VVLGLLLVLFVVALMLLHKIPEDYPYSIRGENYQFMGPFWVVLNYDSRAFMRGAEDLTEILTPDYMRQSRPGMVVVAHFVSKALGPAVTWVERVLASTGRQFHAPIDRWLHQYVAYIAINLTVVLLSFWYYIKLAGSKKSISIAAVAAGALLLFNIISKAFMLTPHTAILELLVPLAVLDLFLRVRRADSIKQSKLIPYSVVFGLAAIGYTGVLIAAPAAVLAEILNRRDDLDKKGWARFPWWGSLATLIMLLPIVAWITFISVRNQGFYVAEFEGEELVWLVEAVRDNVIQAIALLGTKIWRLTWMALQQTWPLLLTVVSVVTAIGPKTVWQQFKGEARKDLPVGAVIVSGLSILFFALIGLTNLRRAYLAVPSLIVLLGWFLERLSGELPDSQQPRFPLAVATALVVTAIIFFIQQGPYW